MGGSAFDLVSTDISLKLTTQYLDHVVLLNDDCRRKDVWMIFIKKCRSLSLPNLKSFSISFRPGQLVFISLFLHQCFRLNIETAKPAQTFAGKMAFLK